MKWTKTIPTKPGPYWLYEVDGGDMHIVCIDMWSGKLNVSVWGNDETWSLREFVDGRDLFWSDEPIPEMETPNEVDD